MKKNLLIAVWFTLVTTVMFGLIYPLGITALAQLCFHDRADGQLISKNGKLVGSRIIGQAFRGPAYFHARPANPGTGYHSTSSGASTLPPPPTNPPQPLTGDAPTLHAHNPTTPLPPP